MIGLIELILNYKNMNQSLKDIENSNFQIKKIPKNDY